MHKQHIVRIMDDAEPGEIGYLGYHSDFHDDERSGEDATLEELADMCDHDAEASNRHSFVGNHRLLAALLYRYVGRQQAGVIMRDIAERGGLHGMNGQGENDSSFRDLGIPDGDAHWVLPA